MAVTTPAALMVATDTGVQLQVPPGWGLLSVKVLPGHMGALPVMGTGNGFTVTTSVALPQVAT